MHRWCAATLIPSLTLDSMQAHKTYEMMMTRAHPGYTKATSSWWLERAAQHAVQLDQQREVLFECFAPKLAKTFPLQPQGFAGLRSASLTRTADAGVSCSFLAGRTPTGCAVPIVSCLCRLLSDIA